MADDNRTPFSLAGIRQRIGGVANLSQSAAVKSVDGSDAADIRRPFMFEQPDYDRTEAPKDQMRKYWRQFETTPIVRKSITSFASRVTEPGYYVDAPGLSEDQTRRLEDWLHQCAILEGQPGKDFRLLARKAVVQREVRGTALVEVAPDKDDDEKVAGLKLINPETMEAVTRPNQTILMAPEDIDEYEAAPEAESGGAAAWLQDILETDQTYWGTPLKQDKTGDVKIGFRRDEIIPLVRDADVGEVFGTSRIEAVSDRIDGIKQKLADNDEAIASKAYPLYLFIFGNEENPWSSSDIAGFMQAHEMENFHPGMKQGVRGDVEVQTISGEVAAIAEYLDFDLRWIMSAMPMPMFVLGSFEAAGIGQVSSIAQQQDINRQIKEARRELEEEFSTVLQRVAEQNGADSETASRVQLKFGSPEGIDPDMKTNQQIIRYVSDAGNNDDDSTEPQSGDMEMPDMYDIPMDEDEPLDDPAAQMWAQDVGDIAELYSFTEQNDIAEAAMDVFTETIRRTLDTVQNRYGSTPQFAIAEFENVANRELRRAIQAAAVRETVRAQLADEISVIRGEYDLDTSPFASDQSSRFYAQNAENAIEDAAEAMLRQIRGHMRRAVIDGESWSDIRKRIETQFNTSKLRSRANLIGYMEMKSMQESSRMQAFEEAEDIVGFRVSNTEPSTELTRSLDGTEVYFDGEQNAVDVIRDAAVGTHRGFDPLPLTPPYHFNDTTTLEPIYDTAE
jgi:hypothetical protein